MEYPIARGRKWLQFSLRTLMLVTLVCCLSLSWYLRYLNRPRPLALAGYCPVTFHQKHRWEIGKSRIRCVYRDQQFWFVSPTEKLLFEANPEKFAPAYDSLDIVALVENERTVRGSVKYGVKYRRKIYLFESAVSLQKFFKSPAKYDQLAQQKGYSVAGFSR